LIHFREQALDLVPAGALAGLTGLADQHHEEIEPMARGTDEAVGAGSRCIAEGGHELEEDGRGMSLGVRSKRTDDLAGKAVQRLFAQMELRGRLQRC
jgi:hypothetical protein